MVALIKTPLQLICAVEYAHRYMIELDAIDFLYLDKYHFSSKQMANTFDYYHITNYKNYRFANSNILTLFGKKIILRNYLFLKAPFKACCMIFNQFQKYKISNLIKTKQCVLIGDPNYKTFYQLVRPIANIEIVLLDDGLSSMQINYDYTINNKTVTSYSFLREEPFYNTIRYLKNEFHFLKTKNKNIDQDKIIIIGQPFLEAKLFSVEEFNGFLVDISNYFANHIIEYIPHRWEMNLEKLTFPKNITIQNHSVELPLELSLIQSNRLPSKIVSFYSSALITLKKILPMDIEIISIDIRKFISNEQIMEAYQFIQGHNIQIIDIIKNGIK